MKKEQRWKQQFEIKGQVKTYYPRSEEQRKHNIEVAKKNGYKVVTNVKLYPFSTMKNQHNFDLIHNIVMCELYDIWNGEKKVSDEEYEKLEHLRDRSEYFFVQDLPIAWLPWKEWEEANELANMAIIHRQNACIENGRPDLVAYC